jgi:hypothetical protein
MIPARANLSLPATSASHKIPAGSSNHTCYYPLGVIHPSVQYCSNVWSILLTLVHERELQYEIGPELGMDASQGLSILQGFFHHFFDAIPDRFLNRFLDRLFHFLRIQTRAPGF